MFAQLAVRDDVAHHKALSNYPGQSAENSPPLQSALGRTQGSNQRQRSRHHPLGGNMVDLRKEGSAPALDLLKQGQQGLFEHGKKLLDVAQMDMKIDAHLCNGRRRRTKSVGLSLSPSRQKVSPESSPNSSPHSQSSPAAPWLPPSSPPQWTQAGVSWLKRSHVDDLEAAAVSVCMRDGSVTLHSNP